MDRTFCQLILVLALSASGAVAQDSQPSSTLSSSPAPKVLAKPESRRVDQFEEAHRLFEKLTPEERRRFADNLQRWQQMPPEEQSALRDREQFRRERIAQEINRAVKMSGLQLDRDRREVYALRYMQERRKIEEQLRQQIETERTAKLAAMQERLKVEFSASTPAPSASATASPK